MSDIIAAIATPLGHGGVGVLRLSGSGCHGTAAKVFRPLGERFLSEAMDRHLLFGSVLDAGGGVIDTGLAFISRAPHSYTGEDTAEIQCHGSPTVLSMVLDALCIHGARQALPGEFTKRAFLNGRLDLTQAEAVADLIDAESPRAARNAAGQLSGTLSRKIDGVYSALTDLMAHFCAVLDYPDEDIDPFRAETIEKTLGEQETLLTGLLATAGRGEVLKRGVTVVLAGRPNGGKSSLLNALAGYERAIVTSIPGTTRDTVEAKIQLGGIPFRLIDTAGLRESSDPVEQMGVQRRREALKEADLILVVCDSAGSLGEEERELLVRKNALLLWSKRDLKEPPPDALSVSAETGEGMEALTALLIQKGEELLPAVRAEEQGLMLTNGRQTEAIRRALDSLHRAKEGLEDGIPPDLLLTDVEEALAALGELTGRTVREDVTDRIFARFCVGK